MAPITKPLTKTQTQVLVQLFAGPDYPANLYSTISPHGKYSKQPDRKNSKGGPSAKECAVNWYMGKLERRGLVWRSAHLSPTVWGQDNRGKWQLTEEGRTVALTLMGDV